MLVITQAGQVTVLNLDFTAVPNLRLKVARTLTNLLGDGPLDLGPTDVVAAPNHTDIMVMFHRHVPPQLYPAIEALLRALSNRDGFETATHTVRMEDMEGLSPDEMMRKIQPPPFQS